LGLDHFDPSTRTELGISEVPLQAQMYNGVNSNPRCSANEMPLSGVEDLRSMNKSPKSKKIFARLYVSAQ
jgi:ribosomal protein L34E